MQLKLFQLLCFCSNAPKKILFLSLSLIFTRCTRTFNQALNIIEYIKIVPAVNNFFLGYSVWCGFDVSDYTTPWYKLYYMCKTLLKSLSHKDFKMIERCCAMPSRGSRVPYGYFYISSRHFHWCSLYFLNVCIHFEHWTGGLCDSIFGAFTESSNEITSNTFKHDVELAHLKFNMCSYTF